MKAPNNMLLAFAPFAAFAVMERFAGPLTGLGVAAAVSALLVVRDALTPARHVKLLELASLFLFGGLGIAAAVMHTHWNRLEVRLLVDTGLCLIVVLSLVLRRPFTLAYTKARTPESAWSTPRFRRLNDVLTAAWALAFAALACIDAGMLRASAAPRWVGIAATAAALLGAFRFSRWYLGRVSLRAH